MSRARAGIAMMLVCGMVACQTGPRGDPPGAATAAPQPNDARLQAALTQGHYHLAMRELPPVMDQWAQYTRRSGETAEGAAGFTYGRTMDAIVAHGDSQWGAILDDPEIPYVYKTEMIFEILEARLGKGAVYMGNDKNLIVPRHGPIDLKDMIRLPQ